MNSFFDDITHHMILVAGLLGEQRSKNHWQRLRRYDHCYYSNVIDEKATASTGQVILSGSV